MPPPPFTLSELDADGMIPERPYTEEEMLGYLAHGRDKFGRFVESLTAKTAVAHCRFAWVDCSVESNISRSDELAPFP